MQMMAMNQMVQSVVQTALAVTVSTIAVHTVTKTTQIKIPELAPDHSPELANAPATSSCSTHNIITKPRAAGFDM